jgi:hypothetical protein
MMTDGDDFEVGRGKPPAWSRWPKGVSGNKRGRPRRQLKGETLPYEAVLGQKLSITENGKMVRVRADQAFIRFLTIKGMEGKSRLARYALKAIEDNRLAQPRPQPRRVVVYSVYAEAGEINRPMRDLGMARMLDHCRPNARMILESWIVQAAVDRLGERRLSVAEQKIVFAGTRMPHKVVWPEWWSVTQPCMGVEPQT